MGSDGTQLGGMCGLPFRKQQDDNPPVPSEGRRRREKVTRGRLERRRACDTGRRRLCRESAYGTESRCEPMISDEEIDRLTTAVDDAIGLAAAGRITQGYALRSTGFLRARGIQRQEAWGEELVERWNL